MPGAVVMKLFSTLLLLFSASSALLADAPKAKPAVPAVPAQPAKPKDGAAKPRALITSDLTGRELAFVSTARDLGGALNYLASAAGKTNNPNLRGFGEDLVKSLGQQSVVLDAIAEMRKLKPAEGESAIQKRWAEKLGKLQGARFEKALLDAFIEVDTQLIAVYESGTKSSDEAIRNLVEQSLPATRKHLELLESMAGIGSKGGAGVPKTAPKAPPTLTPVAEPPAPLPTPPPAPVAKKPAFRTNIRLPEGQL
jgi:hypothetical protein